MNDSSMTKNEKLKKWVLDMADMCKPDKIYWCDGSQEEYDRLAEEAIKNGTYLRLNSKLKPNSFYVQSDPADVARVEDRTFICSKKNKKTPVRQITGKIP